MRKALKTLRPNNKSPETQNIEREPKAYLRSACPSSGILKDYRNTGQDIPEFREVFWDNRNLDFYSLQPVAGVPS